MSAHLRCHLLELLRGVAHAVHVTEGDPVKAVAGGADAAVHLVPSPNPAQRTAKGQLSDSWHDVDFGRRCLARPLVREWGRPLHRPLCAPPPKSRRPGVRRGLGRIGRRGIRAPGSVERAHRALMAPRVVGRRQPVLLLARMSDTTSGQPDGRPARGLQPRKHPPAISAEGTQRARKADGVLLCSCAPTRGSLGAGSFGFGRCAPPPPHAMWPRRQAAPRGAPVCESSGPPPCFCRERGCKHVCTLAVHWRAARPAQRGRSAAGQS